MEQSVFDQLLLRFNVDREQAARDYENIRGRLITFFECRACHAAEEYADITINRVAKKIAAGTEIYASSPAAFFLGVANNVLHEYRNQAARITGGVEEFVPSGPMSDPPDKVLEKEAERSAREQELECLDQCLEGMASKDRDLIIRYYEGESRARITNRKALGAELKLPPNALRIRALRIREKLAGCVTGCLDPPPHA